MSDLDRVRTLLGREPSGGFTVVVRDATGDPVVIRNEPFLHDGTPMPTLYWLCGEEEYVAVSRLEADGGVDRAEAEVDPDELADAHRRYAAERDALIAPSHTGPRPSGGVAGTRTGVKCLHAHFAWFLAGGDDPVGRWVQARLDESRGNVVSRVVAAVDIGTNSTNLLVRDADGHELERVVNITRLGRGVDASRRLNAEAVERTCAVLREYADRLARHGVDPERDLRVITTSAARDAANRDEFFTAVHDAVGRAPDLLSGDDEGRLAHRGALSGLTLGDGWHLLIDIGGGSTELVLGEKTGGRLGVRAVRSLDVGAVRLTERYLHGDPPRPEELTNAIGDAHDLLDDALREIPDLALATRLVGAAGTIVTAAAVEIGQRIYDPSSLHGFRFERDAVEDVFRTLATEALLDRVHNPGLPADRADVIVGGMCVLVAIMRRWDARDILVSAHNIMDGVCAELLETS